MKTNTPEWQAAVADGTLVSWLGAVWSPPLIAQNAPDTEGLWAAVEIPQWDPANPTAGVMGGSGTVVTTQTEHPEEARAFALWLNTSEEAITAYIENASIWPSALEWRTIDALQSPPELMPDQNDFYDLAARIDDYTAPVTWGPNVASGFDSFSNAMSDAVETGSSFADALTIVQENVVAEMTSLGYQVD